MRDTNCPERLHASALLRSGLLACSIQRHFFTTMLTSLSRGAEGILCRWFQVMYPAAWVVDGVVAHTLAVGGRVAQVRITRILFEREHQQVWRLDIRMRKHLFRTCYVRKENVTLSKKMFECYLLSVLWHLPVCLSVCMSIPPSVRPSVCLSVCLSVCSVLLL